MTVTDLPSALYDTSRFCEAVSNRKLCVFLDYDGTLSPIVETPDDAMMSSETRNIVERLAKKHPTAIVSGRSVEKVQGFVQLNGLCYAGSHGFDIRTPNGDIGYRVADNFLPSLQAAFARLQEATHHVAGVYVESNKYALSVHYRKCKQENVEEVHRIVAEIMHVFIDLRLTYGKKVIEVRPNLKWDKGKAVEYLLEALKLNSSEVVPIYIGDDQTDEDAFRALKLCNGVGILVLGDEGLRPTEASFVLRDVDEVKAFLSSLESKA